MIWFVVALLACACSLAAYEVVDSIESASVPGEVLYGMATAFCIGGIVFLLWPSTKQTFHVVMRPQRTTVRYEPPRGAPEPIDVATEVIAGFVTKRQVVPGSSGGTFIDLFMRTHEGDLKMMLYHPMFESHFAHAAAARLNWALTRVRREAPERASTGQKLPS